MKEHTEKNYQVVTAEARSLERVSALLAEKVCAHQDAGWDLQGGVTMMVIDGFFMMAQAMVQEYRLFPIFDPDRVATHAVPERAN